MSSLSQFIGSTTSRAGVVRLTNSVASTSTATAATAAAVKIAYDAAVSSVPLGCILIWSGSVSDIPVGWSVCDGTNGTPDLRDRFVVGAGGLYSSGTTGGSKDSVVVQHTHGVTDPGHFHTSQVGTAPATLGSGQGYYTTWPNVGPGTNTDVKTTGITIQSAGVSGVNANLPPYYALVFIMRTSYV